MKTIIAIGSLLLWLVAVAPAEAQYRARIDQAWKRVLEQQQESCPPAKKKEVESAKSGKTIPNPPRPVPDPGRR